MGGHRLSELPTIADDSGLEVDALDGGIQEELVAQVGALVEQPRLRGKDPRAVVERDREAVVITAQEAESVVREMLQRDVMLRGLEISAPGLEDAFLALTREAKR